MGLHIYQVTGAGRATCAFFGCARTNFGNVKVRSIFLVASGFQAPRSPTGESSSPLWMLQTIAAKCLRSTGCLDSCTGTSPAEQALQGVWSLWLTAWSHREDDQGLVVLQRDTSGHRDRHSESTGKDRGQQYRARKDAMTETCGMSRTNSPDWHVDFQIDRQGRNLRISSLEGVQTWKSPDSNVGNQESRSKIQDFQKTFLGSMVEILDPDEVAGSKISGLDPRKVFWKSWILVLGSISHSDLSPDLSKTWNLKEIVVIYFYCSYYFSYTDWFMIPKSPQFWLWRKGT